MFWGVQEMLRVCGGVSVDVVVAAAVGLDLLR